MSVADEVAYDRDGSRSYLCRHMPPGLHQSQDHASRKEDAPCERLDEDVYPERAVYGGGRDGFACGYFIVASVSVCCGEEEGDDDR